MPAAQCCASVQCLFRAFQEPRPMSSDTAPLLKTPLHDLHVELGARMVPFAGYSMPVQYPAGLMAEHKHTRASASVWSPGTEISKPSSPV